MEREKEIEKRITDFKNIDKKIRILEIELEKIRMSGCPRDIGAIDFGRVGGGSSGGKSAEKVLHKAQELITQIDNLKYEKEIMQNFIDTLTEEQYSFVVMSYFDRLPQNEVLDKMGYSINSRTKLYRVKKAIIEKYEDFVL